MTVEQLRLCYLHVSTTNCVQELCLGGLFTQFSLNSDGKLVVDQGGVRSVPAVQLAIDRINDKSDGIYDTLLPNTQVWLYSLQKFGCVCSNHAADIYDCLLMKLKLLVSDTKIQTKYTLEEAYSLAKRDCVGFIGAWTSGTTMQASKLLSISSIDRAIIAYSASSPRLSEPDFSNVLRTKLSDEVGTKLMTKLMRGLYF